MKLLVNIRGCNGAGKSTIPMLMYERDPEMRTVSVDDNGKAPWITIFPKYGWIALGTYHSKTGGMDTFKNNSVTFRTLEYAWTNYPDYDILMEGVISSTILSTYVKVFKEYKKKVRHNQINRRNILVMNFLPPLEVCIERVLDRNGGTPVKEDQIESKWNSVNRNHYRFLEYKISSVKINTAKISREAMLGSFFKTCDKHRRLK